MAWGRKGIGMVGISAIDLGIWDLMGKIKKKPVFELLGGKTKEENSCLCIEIIQSADQTIFRLKLKNILKEGFKMFKMRFGWGPKDGSDGM